MKRFVRIIGMVVISMSWSARILAAPANHIVISEIQTGSASDASQEFVELYNPTSADLSVDTWTMEYASSAGTAWTKKATLSGTIPAYGFFLLATAGYASGDTVMTSGLAGTSGHVRIKNTNGTVIDVVGWGSAAHPETLAASAPVAGGSIERIPGRLNSLAGNGEDSDSNAADYILREVSEPQRSSSAVEDPSLAPAEVPIEVIEPEPVEETPVVNPTYLPVYISEALPDPASPLTDAKDEYIEVFNPNDQPVNLKGYTIRTGSNFRSYFTIGDVAVAAGGYSSFYSVDTKLGLTNSGGAVQILDPLGNVLDVTDSYSTAKSGQAWADINGVWMWTLNPTPGAANVLAEPAAKATTAASSSTKKATAKKGATKKAAVKKTSKATTKKTSSKMPKTSFAAATEAITDPSPLARWLLIAAGCFTIVYAIYGFRHDLYNYYIKTRTNLGAWLQNWPALPWWRNNRAGK